MFSKHISTGEGARVPKGRLIGLGEMLARGCVSSTTISIDSEQLLVNDSISTFQMLFAGMLCEDVGDWDPSYHPCVSSWDCSGLRQLELSFLECKPMSIYMTSSGSYVFASEELFVLSC